MKNKILNSVKYIKNNKEVKVLSMFAKGNIAVYFIVYVQAVIINSTFEPSDLGKYSYYVSLLTVILSGLSLTIYGAHLRFLAFVNTENLMKFIRNILYGSTILYFMLVLIVWRKWEFIPFVAFIWFNEELYFFRALTRIRLYTGMKFVQHLLIIIFLAVLSINGSLNYENMILLTGFAYLSTYLIFRLFRPRSNIQIIEKEPFSRKDIIKYSMPGAVSSISIFFLAAADQIFINAYLTSLDLSNYAMALRTLAIIKLFTSVFMDYWPRFYFEKAKIRAHKEIKNMGLLFKVFLAVFSLLCILLAVPIYYIMGAGAYIGQSTMIFSVLVFSEIFRVFGSINMTYRSFTKESIYNVGILSSLGLIKLFVNFWLIKKYGLNILLLTTLGSYILYWILSIFLSSKPENLYMQNTIDTKYHVITKEIL